MPIGDLSRQLVRMGYERRDAVEGQGQFSIRGGIVDIYSITEDTAWRIELWGDEIDSIRMLDVETQRSVQRLDSITVYPASEIVVDEEALASGCDRIRTETRQAAAAFRKEGQEEEAARLAATIQPVANANEHGTGYAADILSADDPQQDTSFAETRAYEWLTAYAAEYGFILRYPQDRQTATGIVFEPWHWRYVGVENALAIRASGLSLEEFIALQRAD